MSSVPLGKDGEVIAGRFELKAPARDVGLTEPWTATDRVSGRGALVKLVSARTANREPWGAVGARVQLLGNPRLPKFIAAGADTDRLWIAYEPVQGRSLADWIDGHLEAKTAPGLGVVTRIFDAVASAAQVGHGRGRDPVVHRAISPRSILLDAFAGGHHVVLLDHELAPFVDAYETWNYRAPEQVEGKGDVTPAADVFALAVVLVQLLTLRATPQEASRETWAELVTRTPKGVKSLLQGLRGDISEAFWEAIVAALQASPAKRPPHAQALSQKLRQATPPDWKRLPLVEREPPKPTGAPSVSAPPRERKPSSAPVENWQVAERRTEAPVTSQSPAAVVPTPSAPLLPRTPMASPATPGLPVASLPVAQGLSATPSATLNEAEVGAFGDASDDGKATLQDVDAESVWGSPAATSARPKPRSGDGKETLALEDTSLDANAWNAPPPVADDGDESTGTFTSHALARLRPTPPAPRPAHTDEGSATLPLEGLPPRVGSETLPIEDASDLLHPGPSRRALHETLPSVAVPVIAPQRLPPIVAGAPAVSLRRRPEAETPTLELDASELPSARPTAPPAEEGDAWRSWMMVAAAVFAVAAIAFLVFALLKTSTGH